MSDLDLAFYAGLLREQGVWADGCSVMTCGTTTGHFVRAIAFCDRPETARILAAAISPDATPLPQSITLNSLTTPTGAPK